MQINHYMEDSKETITGLLSGEDIFKVQRTSKASPWKIVLSRTEPFDLKQTTEIIICKVSVIAAIQRMEKENEPGQTTDTILA